MHAYCMSLLAGGMYSLPLIPFARSGPLGGEIGSPVIGFVPCRGSTLAIMNGSLGGTWLEGLPTITGQRLLDASSAADMKSRLSTSVWSLAMSCQGTPTIE